MKPVFIFLYKVFESPFWAQLCAGILLIVLFNLKTITLNSGKRFQIINLVSNFLIFLIVFFLKLLFFEC